MLLRHLVSVVRDELRELMAIAHHFGARPHPPALVSPRCCILVSYFCCVGGAAWGLRARGVFNEMGALLGVGRPLVTVSGFTVDLCSRQRHAECVSTVVLCIYVVV